MTVSVGTKRILSIIVPLMFKRQNDAGKFWNDWRTMFFFSRKSGVFAVAVAFRARDEASITCTRNIIVYRGVMNGPLKFLTARKILPLLDLLAKFKRVLACSFSPNFLRCSQARKANFFYFCSCSQKNRSARHARKDHSSPLYSTCKG